MQLYYSTIFIAILIAAPLLVASIEVVTPPELVGVSLNAPELRCLSNPDPVTGVYPVFRKSPHSDAAQPYLTRSKNHFAVVFRPSEDLEFI
jgi:hypothetical protein